MFTDVHHHLIWGVDDGADTEEETFKMVDEAVANGVSVICCTPHITPGEERFPTERYLDHFERTEAYIRDKGYDLTLYKGNEVLYTDHTARMLQEEKIFTLAGGRFVLTEFVPDDSLDRIIRAAQQIRQAGYVAVFAHVERYKALNKPDRVRMLKDEYGVKIQVNARSVIHKMPLFRRHSFESLFKEDLVDFISSDTHSFSGRKICMKEGYEALCQMVGEKKAKALCYENANEMLGIR